MKKVALLTSLFLSFAVQAKYFGTLPQVTAEQLTSEIDDVVVLDVRSAKEYANAHIPGSQNIPYETLELQIDDLDNLKNKKLVIYCRSGRRAALAESILKENGFKQIYHLAGDFIGWRKKGLPESSLND